MNHLLKGNGSLSALLASSYIEVLTFVKFYLEDKIIFELIKNVFT